MGEGVSCQQECMQTPKCDFASDCKATVALPCTAPAACSAAQQRPAALHVASSAILGDADRQLEDGLPSQALPAQEQHPAELHAAQKLTSGKLNDDPGALVHMIPACIVHVQSAAPFGLCAHSLNSLSWRQSSLRWLFSSSRCFSISACCLQMHSALTSVILGKSSHCATCASTRSAPPTNGQHHVQHMCLQQQAVSTLTG